jgi:RND family efflux transporter MFP subunit
MKRWIKWIVIAAVIVALVGGALRALSARKATKEALEAQQTTLKKQASLELTATDVVAVKRSQMSQGLDISGPLKAVNSAFVKARVAGELQSLTVREGDFVRAGQVIAKVDSTEYQARVRQAQQQAESAKAQIDIAQRSFDNNRSLVDQGFISKTALDTSLASLAAAQANYQAALAGADVATKALDDTVLRAPISGQVSQRLAQPGERIAIDAKVIEIVDASRLELEASLNAADSMTVKVGQQAQLTVEGAAKPLVAKVVRINPTAVSGSRAVLVYLSIAGNPGLRQGLFAQGTLATGTAESLAVPLSAVRTDKPLPYVQWLKDGQLMHVPVTLGARGEAMGQTMVAVSGVAEGSEILSGTAGLVREGTQIKRKQGKQ